MREVSALTLRGAAGENAVATELDDGAVQGIQRARRMLALRGASQFTVEAVAVASLAAAACAPGNTLAPNAVPDLTGEWVLVSDRGSEECASSTNRPDYGLVDERTENTVRLIHTEKVLTVSSCDGAVATQWRDYDGLCCALVEASGALSDRRLVMHGSYRSPPAPQGSASYDAEIEMQGMVIGGYRVGGTLRVRRHGWNSYVPTGSPPWQWDCSSTRTFVLTKVNITSGE